MAQVRLTLVMDSGARIGPGKAALLESVHSTGSISAAARSMGMDCCRDSSCADGLTDPVTVAIAVVSLVLLLVTEIDTLWIILGAAVISLSASSLGLFGHINT
jgi:hypothetical protein